LTISSDLTGKATIIGTAPYMSPEQAAGKDLDARTDIWAFGCILYEALTGRRAFVGESTTEILTAVIEREPDWSKLPDGTPAPLESLLRRCLRKDAQRRLRDIGDARIELEDWLAAPPERESVAGTTRRTALAALAGAATGGGGTALFAISRYRDGVSRNLTRFSICRSGRRCHSLQLRATRRHIT
jgi:serine/threonine protein kinase